jgi:mannose-6-phosphate isomerase-like protein (cupin superfamily)
MLPDMNVVNLREKLDSFRETWVPKVVGSLNGQYVKVAKLEGEYVWHSHADEDEMFLVVHGELVIEFRDGPVTVRPGEFCVVPRGVEHRPVARELVSVVLFEPQTVRNSGDVVNDTTIEADDLEHI